MTVARALVWASSTLAGSSPSARLDAELLLAHTLGWSRARVLAEGRIALDAAQQARFAALVERRAALEPVAYLIGQREFYGLVFEVTPAVLVPRPETELLVERALELARTLPPDALIADIGAGSGAIAVALAVHLPQARISAVDLSPEALAVAGRNAARHGVAGRVRLLQGDLLGPLDAPVDLLVSNPPYTVLAEIDEGVRRHEPHLALDGGPDGLDLYRRLLAAAPPLLRPGGAALLEIGATQAEAVSALARLHFPHARVTVEQDLAGRDRVITIATPGASL
ncbi:MAG TPA: peptide chain release factor N(5)-glutamine methyltransferase [Roseiflexaceae bacterium]|nr:peptide chain release factor N(5)-glutamine methyltransferase [Roseiflexaceae bacterium]